MGNKMQFEAVACRLFLHYSYTLAQKASNYGIFCFYNTYENHQISAVDMHAEDLESNKLICYPVIQGERINYQNK